MDQVGNGGSGTAVSGLAALPGCDLQSAMALIDRRELSGRELALLVTANARLLAWVQASMAATVNEFVHSPALSPLPAARVAEVQQFAADEVALLLHVAPMTATNLVGKAVDLVQRHPRLWAALSDGLIDTRKVNAVTGVCPDTDDSLAAAVDDALLSTAVRPDGSSPLGETIIQTPKALGLRAQRILSMLDPSWVRAVRRETIARRRLTKGSYGIGVGYLGLYDIGVPGMAAAYEHVNAIARGIKRLGDTRTIDQLRADTAIDLLTGGTPSAPVNTTKPAARKPTEPSTTTTANTTTDRAMSAPTGAGISNAGDEDTANESDPEPSNDDTGATADSAETVDEERDPPESEDRADADHLAAPAAVPSPRARADVDLIVHINVLADLADALRRGVLVDVGGFGLVPADVAARLVKAAAARPSVWCMTAVDDEGRVVEHVRTLHDPTRQMRDFVNARDRHCRFPGCTVPAVSCDTDHTTSWETGGVTCPCNMAPLCRRHHRLKQAQGFHLEIDTTSNEARWTTPRTNGATQPPWRHGHDDPAPF